MQAHSVFFCGDSYQSVFTIVKELSSVHVYWLVVYRDPDDRIFNSVNQQVTESSDFSFAVITSSGETKSTGGAYNINQDSQNVVYVFNPALVYGFAVAGSLVGVIGIGACVAAIVVPKCLKSKQKKNPKVHTEEYEDYE